MDSPDHLICLPVLRGFTLFYGQTLLLEGSSFFFLTILHNVSIDYSIISFSFLFFSFWAFFRYIPITSYFLLQAARNNVLLAVPAFLYAINNYLKFTMQVYSSYLWKSCILFTGYILDLLFIVGLHCSHITKVLNFCWHFQHFHPYFQIFVRFDIDIRGESTFQLYCKKLMKYLNKNSNKMQLMWIQY